MNALKFIRTFLTLPALMVVSLPLQAQNPDQPSTSIQPTPAERDGQHDFDFEIGTWKTYLRRFLPPLSGSTAWAQSEGTAFVRKVWNGRANLLVLEVDGPKGHIEALSLRLYNPQSHQWSLNFANSKGGTLSQPTIGGFKDGRGEFFDQEMLHGRAILVRFVISDITANSAHFEQSFSDDGGKTWEVNWIATDTRAKDTPDQAPTAFPIEDRATAERQTNFARWLYRSRRILRGWPAACYCNAVRPGWTKTLFARFSRQSHASGTGNRHPDLRNGDSRGWISLIALRLDELPLDRCIWKGAEDR